MVSRSSSVWAFCPILVLFSLVSAPAVAITVLGGNWNVVVDTERRTIRDDVAIAGQSVSFSGVVDGELFAAASTVGFTGKTTGSAWLAGSNVSCSGPVGGSLRACGSTVSVSGPVAKDLIVGATNFTLNPGSKVGRDLAGAGTNLYINSPVGRNLYIAGTNAVLDSTVGGDALVKAQNFSLLPGAVIYGNLKFEGKSLDIQPGAKVMGKIVKKFATPAGRTPAKLGGFRPLLWLLASLALIIFGAVLTGICPGFVSAASFKVRESFGASLGWGILVGIVGGVAMLIAIGLTFTFVLAPVMLSFLSIYLIIVYASVIFVGAALGKSIFRLFGKGGDSTMLNMLTGTIVLSVVCSVPYVGRLIWLLAAATGLGALLLWLRTRNAPVQLPAQSLPQPSPPASGGEAQST